MPTDLTGDPTWLGDLALNVIDDAGVEWIVTANDGWVGTPGTTQQLVQRQADHGGWPGTSYFTPRALPLAVTINAPSEALRDQAIAALKAAAALTATPMRVKDGFDRTASVLRQGETLVNRFGNVAEVSLSLIAPDPRLYSTTQHTGLCNLPAIVGGLVFPITFPITFTGSVSSGAIPVSNQGNIDSPPLLRITGPVVTPVVTLQRSDGTVQQLTYQGSLGALDYLDLDCGPRRTAILNATASRRGLLTVTGGWPQIPPDTDGVSSTLFFNAASSSGTPALAASWNDAWE